MRLFPYRQFREGQREIYETVANFLASNEAALYVEAPPGLGKTSAILSAALEAASKPAKPRVVWVTRTHAEQEVVERELAYINYRAGTRFSMLHIRGLERYCTRLEARTSTFPSQLCEHYRARGVCPSCRYGLQFAAARQADVVTVPSAYLKAGAFAKVSAVFEAAQGVVFDECHHLFPPEQRVPRRLLELARAELGGLPELERLAEAREQLRVAGERVWRRRGQSAALELSRLLAGAEEVYELEGGGLGFADFSALDAIRA